MGFLHPELSAMIRGADDSRKFVTVDYKEEDLPNIFDTFFKSKSMERQDSLNWGSYEPM